MKFRLIAVLSFFMSAAVLMPGSARTADAEEGAVVELSNAVVFTAEVIAVDQKDHAISLRDPDGKVVVLEAGPEARNFGQVTVGDRLKIEASNSVELFLDKPGTQQAGMAVERAPEGEKPGGRAVEKVDLTAKVKAIDKKERAVTLELPNGSNVITKAHPSDKGFDKLKVGDSFQARLTRSIAISVGKE